MGPLVAIWYRHGPSRGFHIPLWGLCMYRTDTWTLWEGRGLWNSRRESELSCGAALGHTDQNK